MTNNTNLDTKVNVENVHLHLKVISVTKKLLTSILVDIRIYLPLTVIFTLSLRPP